MGLTLDLPDSDDVGLFGALGETSVVEYLHLIDFVVSGDDPVGLLAGRSAGTASHVSATGTVDGNRLVGGPRRPE